MQQHADVQRLPAEQLFQAELTALADAETRPVPVGWRMSPWSVRTYICGGRVGDVEITPKYMGNERLVEIAIATLLTDRALLLVGEPGTAKSWLSEHLCAAINGDSTRVIQGTAGTTEEQIRYSWNYALLIAEGPSERAMLKSPVLPGYGRRGRGPLRGDLPLRRRSAGRAHLPAVGKARQRPGAAFGRSGPARDSPSSPRPTRGTRGSMTCPPP